MDIILTLRYFILNNLQKCISYTVYNAEVYPSEVNQMKYA